MGKSKEKLEREISRLKTTNQRLREMLGIALEKNGPLTITDVESQVERNGYISNTRNGEDSSSTFTWVSHDEELEVVEA
jgi:cell shape-determining protein MreC